MTLEQLRRVEEIAALKPDPVGEMVQAAINASVKRCGGSCASPENPIGVGHVPSAVEGVTAVIVANVDKYLGYSVVG